VQDSAKFKSHDPASHVKNNNKKKKKNEAKTGEKKIFLRIGYSTDIKLGRKTLISFIGRIGLIFSSFFRFGFILFLLALYYKRQLHYYM
jgi:hypothetical protein